MSQRNLLDFVSSTTELDTTLASRPALQRNATLKPASSLQYLFLSRFSRPRHERCLYRALRRLRARSIVEIGMGEARRALRMLSVAMRYRPHERLSYAGIDLFEARPADSPGLRLKDAHKRLIATGVQLRLVPGDPFAALARCANSLANTDLVVISADHDPAALEPAWFYIPRMLHERSLILLEEQSGEESTYYRMTLRDLQSKTTADAKPRAA
jgi:hypothetical protein